MTDTRKTAWTPGPWNISEPPQVCGQGFSEPYCSINLHANKAPSAGAMMDGGNMTNEKDDRFIKELEQKHMSDWTVDELERYSFLTGQTETREQKANRLIKDSGKTIHSSDCATSIAPAEEPDACDCDEDDDSPSPREARLADSEATLSDYLGSQAHMRAMNALEIRGSNHQY